MEEKIKKLNDSYSRIQEKFDLEETEIAKEITALQDKIGALRYKSFTNQSESIKKKNEFVVRIGDDALKDLSGNIVGIHFYSDAGDSFADVNKLNIERKNEIFTFQEEMSEKVKIARPNVGGFLEGIVKSAESFEKFVNHSEEYCSKLTERTLSVEKESLKLLMTLPQVRTSQAYNEIMQSNNSVKLFIPEIKEAAYILADKTKKIDKDLSGIISEFCELPISGFKKRAGLYVKEKGESASIIIDNSKNLISNKLLKKIDKVNAKNIPRLMYMELGKKEMMDLLYSVEDHQRQTRRKSNLGQSIREFGEEHMLNSGVIFGVTGTLGATGKMAYEWFESWRNQIPVESLTGPLYAGLIVGSALTAFYLADEGLEAIGHKLTAMQRAKKTNNELVDLINKSNYSFIPREIARNLISGL